MKRFISPLKNTENIDAASKKIKLYPKKTKSDEHRNNIDLLAERDENYDYLFDDDADFNIDLITTNTTNRLKLNEWKRCKVTAIERDSKTYSLILHVVADNEGVDKWTTCHLMGPWCYTKVTVNDIVSLQGVWNESLQSYCIDRDHGFCVINPDTLISGTTVVGSLFCARKAVLQERFRGLDGDNKVMVIGTLVHELLQITLENRLSSIEQIRKVAHDLLRLPSTAFLLYASRLSNDDVEAEIRQFIPNIYNFISKYLTKQPGKANIEENLSKGEKNFEGEIVDIEDIEENLWIPQFGLKGKIDVSIRVRKRPINSRNKNEKMKNILSQNFEKNVEDEQCVPLELKTGRASFSMEHKGQLILYLMMLTATGRSTNSGLLLYLRENVMRQIEGSHNEQRDLINLRNDLSYYLTSYPHHNAKDKYKVLEDDKFEQPFELPEPINHPIACKNCPYLTLCCTFARTDSSLQLSSNHNIKKLIPEQTSHLKIEDFKYFIKWCHFLILDEKESRKTNYLSALWTKTPEERYYLGRALINLILLTDKIKKDENDSRYIHKFKTNHGFEQDFTVTDFTVGDYVIVSTRKRLAVDAGYIVDISSGFITLNLERNLSKKYCGDVFIIDKHESQTNNVFNYTNLGILLDNDDRSKKLRDIIIHRSTPTFTKILPKRIAGDIEIILESLNQEQRSAALKALTSEDFMLIKGLPGTGKTQTLVAIVRLLHLMGKSVVITSHTHSAVDNLLIRLKMHSIPFLRLGSQNRVNDQVREFSESVLTEKCTSERELSLIYNSYNIIGVTCLGFSHVIFSHRQFDVCIMDEATQVFQVTALRPLFHCKRFILVGDPEQLPPLVRSNEARNQGADESLFHRLDSPDATFVLTLQYRMNQTITRIANKLTYQGALQCATNKVKTDTILFSGVNSLITERWLQRTLQTHLDHAVFVLDTLDCSKRQELFYSDSSLNCKNFITSDNLTEQHRIKSGKLSTETNLKYMNYSEVAIILYIVEKLLLTKYDAKRIGIIAPYRAHVDLLRKECRAYELFYQQQKSNDYEGLKLNFCDIEINTVDQYQGRDKDIILYSCARTGRSDFADGKCNRDMEILEDKRRLTVAITRAKLKLIIVGDITCIEQYKPFRALLQYIPRLCQLQLIDGKHDFHWSKVFENLHKIKEGCRKIAKY